MRLLSLALAITATLASAQESLENQTVWERCYGSSPAPMPQPWLANAYFTGSQPAPTTGGGSSRPAPLTGVPSGGGAGAGYALLAAAVVAVAALPVVVYVIDGPAPDSVRRRFHCPTFSFESSGGAQLGTGYTGVAGLVVGRVRTGYSYFGTDFLFDVSPGGVGSYAFDLLLRVPPKQHIEGALAVGFKRAEVHGVVRNGIEFALPHQYVLWRDERRQFGIELRPGVFVHPAGVDLSVELALSIPIVDFLSARIASSAFSFDGQVMFGVSTGLALHL